MVSSPLTYFSALSTLHASYNASFIYFPSLSSFAILLLSIPKDKEVLPYPASFVCKLSLSLNACIPNLTATYLSSPSPFLSLARLLSNTFSWFLFRLTRVPFSFPVHSLFALNHFCLISPSYHVPNTTHYLYFSFHLLSLYGFPLINFFPSLVPHLTFNSTFNYPLLVFLLPLLFRCCFVS